MARARFCQRKEVLWVGYKLCMYKRGKEGRKKITGVDALTHGVAENARWALHVAGAVAGVGIAWFYIKSMEVHVSRYPGRYK
jgi:hypothetical protein